MINVSLPLRNPLRDFKISENQSYTQFLQENIVVGDGFKSNLGVAYVIVFVLFALIYGYRTLGRKAKVEDGPGKGNESFKRNIPQANIWLSFFAPLDVIYYMWKIRKDGIHAIDEYTKKFGKIFKIRSLAIKHYIVSDPDVIQKVLNSTDFNYLGKPSFFRRIIAIIGLEDSVFTLGGLKWSHRRKLLNRSFSYKSLQSYLGTMNKTARIMVDDINSSLIPFEGGDKHIIRPQDLFEIQNLCTIKTAASIVMGAEISTDEENIQFHEDFRNGKDLSVFRLFRPWLISDLIFRLYPERKLWNKSIDGALVFILKIISTYKVEQEKLKAEGKLIKFMEDDEQQDVGLGLRQHRSMIEEMLYTGLTDKEVIDEVVTFMIGGHESTMTTISSFFLHMALNPEVQAKCHQEIDELFASKEQATFDLSMDDLSDLKYMERCLMEVLRLTTTIPIFQRGMAAPLKIDESLEFEKGSNVLINLWSLHIDPEHFPDPLKFDPDRFLPENCKSRHKYAYIPFSSGIRNCIAWKMAMIQVKVVMTWILREFQIESKKPDLKFEDIKFMYELTIKPEKDIEYVLKRRLKN